MRFTKNIIMVIIGCVIITIVTGQKKAPLLHPVSGIAGEQGESCTSTLPASLPLETMILSGGGGLSWELQRGLAGWTLGVLQLGGKPIDASLDKGVLLLRSPEGQDRWLPASECKKLDDRTACLSGKTDIDGVRLHFSVEIRLRDDMPTAEMTPTWSVDKDLTGWEMCVTCFNTTVAPWRCTFYPFVGNADSVAIPRLMYTGVPAALLFRQNMSMVALFGIDPATDYFNPATWRGTTGLYFQSGVTSPQFRVGGVKLVRGVYTLPIQVFLSSAGNSVDAVTELTRDWVKANQFQVEPLMVRTPQEAFDLFLTGRTQSKMWKPGLGYQMNTTWPIVCPAESPVNAYMDYLLYEQTGDLMWRQRAFDAMSLMLRAQHTDPADPHFGVLETNYELEEDPSNWHWGWRTDTSFILPFTGEKVDPDLKSGRFNSSDHAKCYGFKLDKNGYAARYALLLWERVKAKEGLDKKEWYTAAVRIAEWIIRQQNPDGGLPMIVDYRPGAKKSISVVSGRTLLAMPIIARITGEEKYLKLAHDMEEFLRWQVESRYWFTGSHVDLWPEDLESDSVWQAVEYWLNKYDQTNDPECLKRAEADVWFSFLMWCPKQLSWVNNPTQTCHAEQQNFLQYSNYCYQNRKIDCLDRLSKLSSDPLFGQLRDRIIQCGFWGQVTSGDAMGGLYERMSDPWLKRGRDINSTGHTYVSQLAMEPNLQLLEMGWVRAGNKKNE